MAWVPGYVEVSEHEVRVCPPRPWGRRFGWVAVLVALASLVMFLDGLREHASTSSIVAPGIQVLLWASFAAQALGPAETVVDTSGIRRPWRRTVPWSEIERVRRPGRYDDGITVQRRNGRPLRVHAPREHAPDIARVGHVPLEQ